MLNWLLAALLVIQAHVAASYLVPLDKKCQGAFAGLLRWAWPRAIGDGGPLGQLTASGFPMAGFYLGENTAAGSLLAAFAVVGIWILFGWWRESRPLW